MQMYVCGGAHVHSLVTSCHESCCYADVCMWVLTSIVWSPHATSHAAMQMYVCGCSRPQCGHLMPRVMLLCRCMWVLNIHSVVTSCHEVMLLYRCMWVLTSIVWSPHATSHAAMQMYVGAHIHSVVTSCHKSCCYADVCMWVLTSIVWSPHATSHAAMQMYVCGCSRPQCGHLMPQVMLLCRCMWVLTSIVWSPHATSHAAMQMYVGARIHSLVTSCLSMASLVLKLFLWLA